MLAVTLFFKYNGIKLNCFTTFIKQWRVIMDIKNTFFNALKNKSGFENTILPEEILGNIYTFPASDDAFLTLLSGGLIAFSAPVSFVLNPFPSYLLLFTVSGKGSFLCEGNTCTLDAAHCLFFDCSKPFTLEQKGRNWKFYLFFLSGNALSSYYKIFHEAYDVLYPVPAGSHLPLLLPKLSSLPSQPSRKEAVLCHKYLTDIFTEFCTLALTQSENNRPPADYLLTMKDAFDHHYDQEYSLAYFEETTGISRYRLCREFSAAFSLSPLQYLNQKRIEAAKELLLNSDMPVHEVGSAVGIDNTNHFINLFKKYTGTTPFVFKQEVPASIRELRSLYKPDDLLPR